jgi:hypothetical protein
LTYCHLKGIKDGPNNATVLALEGYEFRRSDNTAGLEEMDITGNDETAAPETRIPSRERGMRLQVNLRIGRRRLL